MQLEEILRTAHEQDASDIHLISGHPPMIRVNTSTLVIRTSVVDLAKL